tara:strand:+ start:1171 stop:1398 length:228 start_codon:yes stop_codon:yes gene_type:complete
MSNNVFYNNKKLSEDFKKKNLSQVIKKNHREVVDINKLLNRVKINKYNEKKRQIILFSAVTLLLIAIGAFISIVK